MPTPPISKHYQGRTPSAIRLAQILFERRPDKDEVGVINLAVGNVSLPMHPAMRQRMASLAETPSPFAEGTLRYTPSVGMAETRRAFTRLIEIAGFDVEGLECLVTDGGSQAMELMILGVAGPAATRPIMLLEPVYTNYIHLARRVGSFHVAAPRSMDDLGRFSPPDIDALEREISRTKPVALIICPADNPTGQFISQAEMNQLGALCVRHNIWLVSDEAYRQLHYLGGPPSSIWGITEADVPGIRGRRISIESASKVWNACGLRIGALVTDSPALHTRAVAEYTANLCANALGQYIFGALAVEPVDALKRWYESQREHYSGMMTHFVESMRAQLPGVLVSDPDASLYSVVDLRALVDEDFNAGEFTAYCAERGAVELHGERSTLLVAPMTGFYEPGNTSGRTQLRIAYVESSETMLKVPALLARLFEDYQRERSAGAS